MALQWGQSLREVKDREALRAACRADKFPRPSEDCERVKSTKSGVGSMNVARNRQNSTAYALNGLIQDSYKLHRVRTIVAFYRKK